MAIRLIRADSGVDTVIWLILGALWLIAQAVAKFRGGGREPRPPPPVLDGDKSLAEDLKTLFEQLRDQNADQREPPVSPPRPIAGSPKPISYGAVKRLPKPSRPERKTVKRVEPVRVMPEPAVVVVEKPLEVQEIPSLSIARSRGGMLKESTFSFNAIKTSLMIEKPLGVNPMGTGASLRRRIKGRKEFKHAMISRIVLGPPKAFSL